EKIERALNPRMREFLSTLPDVITTKAGPRLGSQTSEQLTATRRLFEAVRDRRVIEMSYYSVSSQQIRSYRAEPYRLTLAQGGLYLVAWVPEYDAFRTFATDRIQHLRVTEDAFTPTHELPVDVFGQ